MKIFKTILWTTFFWILVVLWLRIASYWYADTLAVAVPKPIKEAIVAQHVAVECDCEKAEPAKDIETTKVDEKKITEEIKADEGTKNLLNSTTSSNSEDYSELEERVTTLESNYESLVSELQQIFAVPALQQLILSSSTTTTASSEGTPFVVEETTIDAE